MILSPSSQMLAAFVKSDNLRVFWFWQSEPPWMTPQAQLLRAEWRGRRSAPQRYTVERQLMTDDIITRKNLINQSATKQRPVLSFTGTCPWPLCHPHRRLFHGGVCARSESHYQWCTRRRFCKANDFFTRSRLCLVECSRCMELLFCRGQLQWSGRLRQLVINYRREYARCER